MTRSLPALRNRPRSPAVFDGPIRLAVDGPSKFFLHTARSPFGATQHVTTVPVGSADRRSGDYLMARLDRSTVTPRPMVLESEIFFRK